MTIHLFTLLFVALKLTNVINWSWWLVLLPSYGAVLFTIAAVLLVAALK